MKLNGIPVNTHSYNAAISVCGHGGYWEQAVALMREMEETDVERNAITFTLVSSLCRKSGQNELASEIMGAMHRSLGKQAAVVTAKRESEVTMETLEIALNLR